MPASDSKVKANDRYNRKVYESIGFRVHKGTRSEWKKFADREGLSLAAFIVEAVSEYIENHPADDPK